MVLRSIPLLPTACRQGGRAVALRMVRPSVRSCLAPSITRLLHTTAPRALPEREAIHFRNSPGEHPLGVEKNWVNPTINHVWTEDEVAKRLSEQPRHQPVHLSEKVAHSFLQFCYKTFNFVTGYKAEDPTPESVAFRLIFLESVAGVPGMVAAQHRHFRSLRTLSRDYGWIHTLLEEAENERMHLLTFLRTFPPGPFTRASIFVTQFGFGSLFITLYVASPSTAHRLVGYIEEMAVVTYTNLIEMMETPGTQLHDAWRHMPAPEIAKTYWRLPEDADFLDVIKQVAADETNHRDVNHTFASMARDDINPYVGKHLADMAEASQYWRQIDQSVDGTGLGYTMDPAPKPKVGPAKP